MKMLQSEMRMDEIPRYKEQLSEDLTLLQDATIHAALSSAEQFSSLQRELDSVAHRSERLVDMINASDLALKGLPPALASLRLSPPPASPAQRASATQAAASPRVHLCANAALLE